MWWLRSLKIKIYPSQEEAGLGERLVYQWRSSASYTIAQWGFLRSSAALFQKRFFSFLISFWCKLDWKMSEFFITGIFFPCMSTARQRKKCSKLTFVRDYSMSLERPKITHILHCPVLLAIFLRDLKIVYFLKGTFIRKGMTSRNWTTTLLGSQKCHF